MSLVDEISLGLNISRLFGLAPFRINKKGQLTTTLWENFYFFVNIVNVTLITAASLALSKIAHKIMSTDESSAVQAGLGRISNKSEQIQRLFALITYIVLMVWAVAKKNGHIAFWKLLFECDQMATSLFAVNLHYTHNQKLNRIFYLVLLVLVYMGSIFIFAYMFYTKNFDSHSPGVLIYTAALVTTPVHSAHYRVMCSLVIRRFEVVEKLANQKLNKASFFSLLKMNSLLRDCVSELNDSHGMQMFFNLTNDTILITMQAFFAFYSILSTRRDLLFHSLTASILWIVPQAAKMLLVIFAGENLKNQVGSTNKAISENYHRRFDGREAEILSGCPMDKLYGEELCCDAGEFFVIDYTLIYHVVASLTTYLVVLLQFQGEEAEESEAGQ